MNKNLDFYIKTYSLLNEKECKKIIKTIKTYEWSQHEYSDPITLKKVAQNGSKELDVSYDKTENETHQLLMKKIWDSFSNYLNDLKFPWYHTWAGFTPVRYNRYKNNQIMSIHCDHIHTIFEGQRRGIPTMTALGLLNENYEGGQLVMLDQEITMKTGDIIVFPSNFLYPHGVKPVIKGTRYSFVSWAF